MDLNCCCMSGRVLDPKEEWSESIIPDVSFLLYNQSNNNEYFFDIIVKSNIGNKFDYIHHGSHVIIEGYILNDARKVRIIASNILVIEEVDAVGLILNIFDGSIVNNDMTGGD